MLCFHIFHFPIGMKIFNDEFIHCQHSSAEKDIFRDEIGQIRNLKVRLEDVHSLVKEIDDRFNRVHILDQYYLL